MSSTASLLSWRTYFTPINLVSLLVALLSIGLLAWFNSQLQPAARVDVTLPAAPATLWQRWVRGVGWLLDQQRGLLIYGPIYIAALWGLPLLLATCLKERNRHGLLLLPFLLSLALATVAGGFWIAWEVGPRYLVVGLPALAPLLALAWVHYRRSRLWQVSFLLLLGVSLLNSRAIIQNSELPYKSSLPLFYGEMLGLPLTDWLPDLADHAHLFLSEAEKEGVERLSEGGEPFWLIPSGPPLNLIKTEPLDTMPYGHYLLTWPLRPQAQLPPEAELARISINLLGGGQVLNQVIKAADLAAPASDTFQTRFLNPNVDRWRTPMLLHASATGQAGLQVWPLWLRPDPFYALFLPYLYLGLLAGGALLSWFWTRSAAPAPAQAAAGFALPRPGKIGWLFGIAPLLAMLYLLFMQSRPGQTYDAATFFHFVGRPLADPAAHDGQAWQVDPAIDPPQKAIYGPFDFYEAGLYQVSFRVKLPAPADPELEVARLQVSATANYDPLLTQSLQAKHFSKIDFYHDLVLTIQNPRRQALSFELYYLGVAPLVIDEVTLMPAEP